jgi:hypothetical protein
VHVTISFIPVVMPEDQTVNPLVLDQATIQEVDMDYDLLTVLDVVGAEAGDAHPLVVYDAEFTYINISQSTSVPFATSVITLRFSTSLALTVNQTLALSFPDFQSCGSAGTCPNVWTDVSGIKLLGGPDKDFFKAGTAASPGTACWSTGRADAGGIEPIRLMLYVSKETIAGHIYEVTIAFTNPLPAQTSIAAHLRVLNVGGKVRRCAGFTFFEEEVEQPDPDSWAQC